IHPGYLSLQQLLGRIDDTGIKLPRLQGFDRPGNISFLRITVTYDDHFLEPRTRFPHSDFDVPPVFGGGYEGLYRLFFKTYETEFEIIGGSVLQSGKRKFTPLIGSSTLPSRTAGLIKHDRNAR